MIRCILFIRVTGRRGNPAASRFPFSPHLSVLSCKFSEAGPGSGVDLFCHSVSFCSPAWQRWCSLWLLLAFSVHCLEADKRRTRHGWKGNQHVFVIQPTEGRLFTLPRIQTQRTYERRLTLTLYHDAIKVIQNLGEAALPVHDIFNRIWLMFHWVVHVAIKYLT